MSADLTDHQTYLLSWLRYYDWVTSGEGPPPPSQEILEHDDALDDYVQDWKDSLKAKKSSPSGHTQPGRGQRVEQRNKQNFTIG